jgi:hypothetical protein
MLTIKKIKIVTPKNVLKLQGEKGDNMSETKMARIMYMMGWVCNLFKEVKHEVKEFYKWVDSLDTIRLTMNTVGMNDIRSLVQENKQLDIAQKETRSHDSDESSQSEDEDNDSEEEEEEEESEDTPTNIDPPAASVAVATPAAPIETDPAAP